jgi:hypothetical protein
LFDLAHPKSMLATPLGFRYQADFISATEEQELAAALGNLPLKPFEFHGHLGNRRVLSFGLRYDYTRREVQASAAPPEFLDSLLKKVTHSRVIRFTSSSRLVSMNIGRAPGLVGIATSQSSAMSWAFHFCRRQRYVFAEHATAAGSAVRAFWSRAPFSS